MSPLAPAHLLAAARRARLESLPMLSFRHRSGYEPDRIHIASRRSQVLDPFVVAHRRHEPAVSLGSGRPGRHGYRARMVAVSLGYPSGRPECDGRRRYGWDGGHDGYLFGLGGLESIRVSPGGFYSSVARASISFQSYEAISLLDQIEQPALDGNDGPSIHETVDRDESLIQVDQPGLVREHGQQAIRAFNFNSNLGTGTRSVRDQEHIGDPVRATTCEN